MVVSVQDRMRLDTQRREHRETEALQSPKWDSKLVAEHSFRWLKQHQHLAESTLLKDAVGMLLHRMVLDGEFASSMSIMLNLWKAWADNRGMRRTDLNALHTGKKVFAQASLLVAMIKDTTAANEGTLPMDLQECISIWRTVRLG